MWLISVQNTDIKWCFTLEQHRKDQTGGGIRTDRRHLRKPVEFKMLLRPILLHVARYSEYISDRDTEPSGFVSKCAFSLFGRSREHRRRGFKAGRHSSSFLALNSVFPLFKLRLCTTRNTFISPLQCKLLPVQFNNARWRLRGLN